VEVCEVSVICGVHAHWSHPNTILKCNITDLEGSEECGRILGESGSCWWVLDGREVGSVGCRLVSGCRYRAHCNGRYMYICINSRAKDQKVIEGVTVTKGVRKWRTEGRGYKRSRNSAATGAAEVQINLSASKAVKNCAKVGG
jgi:hypothetical protein